MCNEASLPNCRASALAFERNSACTWRVRLTRFATKRQRLISGHAPKPTPRSSPAGLQGHAIKNQDLLIASGSLSLKGQEGLSAVDDDLQVAVRPSSDCLPLIGCSIIFLIDSIFQSQLQTHDNLEPNLRQRDRELSEIAKSIADLAVLFKDLSSMVIDQGTLLDSVEYNIEQTSVQMTQAVKELDVATRCVSSNVIFTSSQAPLIMGRASRFMFRYQKNTGRRSCIFLLLLIIFGLIIVLIFKPRRHSSPTPQPPLSGDASGDIAADVADASGTRRTFRRVIPM